MAIKQFDERIELRKLNAFDPKKETSLERFADIDPINQTAEINTYKIDQLINEAYTVEVYNNIDKIKEARENASYEVQLSYSGIKLETTTSMNRKSKSQQLKEDYHEIIN